MSGPEQKDAGTVAPKNRKNKVGRVFAIAGAVVLLVIFFAVITNSLLVMFKDDYYTTFGNYRLFAIVTDSMEPEIPQGSMIVDEKPSSPSAIKVGSIITYKVKNANGETVLLTHRVTAISTDSAGNRVYTTKGDNAGGADRYKPKYADVVGIYTGKKCGFFGSLFGFFQSALGVSVLIFGVFVVIVAWVVIWYVNATERRRKLKTDALKKSAQALSNVNLRYDNINEITAVMDVLGMVTDEPQSRADSKEIAARLREFIRAENIELPQTPETAAILESLPAPDTPSALAAALSAGATLRQAEDGQTLVLTTSSGEKNIMLTPVQTADGVILCQQGVRMRSDIAPNIEDVGVLSMPASPEFFEGQPLEKNVVYPELPQPAAAFGPEMLLNNGNATGQPAPMLGTTLSAAQSSEQTALGSSRAAQQPLLESGVTGEARATEKPAEQKPAPRTECADGERDHASRSRKTYAQYREQSARLELQQAEQLSELLTEVSPLSYDEQLKVAEYKAAHAKPKAPRKQRSPEEREKARQASERKKREQQQFLDSLSDEDRELYITEQKLARARGATIRRLKRIAADRKLLEKLD